MRVLVTGGAGFIGSNLVDALLIEGHTVRVLDNFSTGRRENLSSVLDEAELIEGDLRSYERVSRAIRGTEVVFHQGALPSVPRSIQDPLTSSEINVGGTLNVLLAARDEGVRRVVFASSSSVYGDAPGYPRTEDQATRPLAPYAVSKLAAEQYCTVAHRVYGLETVALRYFNVFGSRQDPLSEYSAVVPRFVRMMLSGRAPTVFGDGTQARDFTHVDDVVRANVLAMTAQGVVGRVINVARGEEHSLNDLVDALNEILDTDLTPQYREPRPGDVMRSLASIELARTLLDYTPMVSFQEGLARTVDTHRNAAASN